MSTGALCALSRIVARRGPGGATRLEALRCSPPLALRPAAGSVWMVGTAAGPLPGDRLGLHIDVGPGASLTLRSTAATVALGGQGDDHSELRVQAEVGAGGELRWLPEPTVATAGCHHRIAVAVALAPGARLEWRDELVLGRHGEGPGRLTSRIDVEAEEVAVVRQELRVGAGAPGWDGPSVTPAAGAVGTVVVIGDGLRGDASRPGPSSLGPEVAVLALAGRGAMVSAVAPDAPELRLRLDAGLAALEESGTQQRYGRVEQPFARG